MKVTIGEISAKCPGCQGDEFELVGEDGGLKHERRYRCASCHAEERYGMLLVNIGEQALERAKLARGKAPKK